MNLGVGRVVMQELPRIDQAVAEGSIAETGALTSLIGKLKATGGACHLMGLQSPGGMHAHQDHVIALVKILNAADIPVARHGFLDGRDTPPKSALDYVEAVEADIAKTLAKIATLCGRYYAMDRNKRWDPVQDAACAAGHARHWSGHCALCAVSGLPHEDPVLCAVCERVQQQTGRRPQPLPRPAASLA